MTTVTGLFMDRQSAERAYSALVELGHDIADVDVVMSPETRDRWFAGDGASRAAGTSDLPSVAIPTSASAALAARTADEGSSAPAARKLGGPLGGTLGTLAAGLAALGTVAVLPGLGIVLAGPVAAALTAAGSVGVAGGLVSALAHWGLPRERVSEYESGLREGGALLGVAPRSEDEAVEIERRWQAVGGRLVHR